MESRLARLTQVKRRDFASATQISEVFQNRRNEPLLDVPFSGFVDVLSGDPKGFGQRYAREFLVYMTDGANSTQRTVVSPADWFAIRTPEGFDRFDHLMRRLARAARNGATARRTRDGFVAHVAAAFRTGHQCHTLTFAGTTAIPSVRPIGTYFRTLPNP
jgi:hypothetical protein